MAIYDNKYFLNPVKIIKAFDIASFKKAFELIEKYKKNYYLLGYIKYEAKDFFIEKPYISELPVIYFEVYEKFYEYIPQGLVSNVEISTYPDIDKQKYLSDVEKIRTHIKNGTTYEVNYTYSNTVETNCDDNILYEYLLKKQKTPYNAFIKNRYETILSFSPELFFSVKNNKIITKPMKGTIHRGSIFTPTAL